jgi:hypothetical protein
MSVQYFNREGFDVCPVFLIHLRLHPLAGLPQEFPRKSGSSTPSACLTHLARVLVKFFFLPDDMVKPPRSSIRQTFNLDNCTGFQGSSRGKFDIQPRAKAARHDGIVEEGEEVMAEGKKKDETAADLALIGAAQRVEHYEMVELYNGAKPRPAAPPGADRAAVAALPGQRRER